MSLYIWKNYNYLPMRAYILHTKRLLKVGYCLSQQMTNDIEEADVSFTERPVLFYDIVSKCLFQKQNDNIFRETLLQLTYSFIRTGGSTNAGSPFLNGSKAAF